MFVFNFKAKPSKKLFVIFSVMSIVTAVVCVYCMVSMQNAMLGTATCDEIGEYSVSAQNAGEELDFLSRFSIEADGGSRIEKAIVIPQSFNETYEEYNNLQKRQGLDLSRYKGKDASMVKYSLKDSKYRYALLLVRDGRVIGAHLTNGEYGSKNVPLTEEYGQTR